jgi:hypothetical protein
MKRFYRHLGDGSNKETAVRKARLDVIKEFGRQGASSVLDGIYFVIAQVGIHTSEFKLS